MEDIRKLYNYLLCLQARKILLKFEDIKPEIFGITFGVFALGLLYFLVRFSDLALDGDFVGSYIYRLKSGEADFLPIPVFIALLLFVLREVLDWIKKENSRKRKISAYKSLIAEELELNYGSYLSLHSIFKELEDTKEEWDGAKYEAKFREAGNLYVHVTLDGDLKMSSPARKASMKQYDQLLVGIAEEDEEFYESLQKGYDKIVELELY